MPNGTASGTRVLRAASTPPLRVKQGSRDGSGAYGTISAAGTVLLPTTTTYFSTCFTTVPA